MIQTTERMQRPNIKELILGDTNKSIGLHFDPEMDLTKENWENMKNFLQVIKNSQNKSNYGREASNLLILFPERRKELDLLPCDELLKSIIPSSISVTLPDVRILYPESVTDEIIEEKAEFKFNVYKNTFQENSEYVKYWTSVRSNILWEAFVLYPERFNELAKTENLIDTFNLAADQHKKDENWIAFSKYKFFINILDNKHRPISDDEWVGMKSGWRETIFNSDRAQLAMQMKLLAAKEVKMTEKGLQVIMPEEEIKHKIPSVDLPVMRRF
jgi:hypothetical protein